MGAKGNDFCEALFLFTSSWPRLKFASMDFTLGIDYGTKPSGGVRRDLISIATPPLKTNHASLITAHGTSPALQFLYPTNFY
jgi:hypothetical protein